jgi:hypothetical protein
VVIEGSVIRDVRSGGRVPETLDGGGTVIDAVGRGYLWKGLKAGSLLRW